MVNAKHFGHTVIDEMLWDAAGVLMPLIRIDIVEREKQLRKD